MKKKVLILGFGKSGSAARQLALSKGFHPIVIDERKSSDFSQQLLLVKDEISEFYFGGELPLNPKAELVVTSPGIAKNSRIANFAKTLKSPIISELQFACSFSRKPMLAITGTNGKTTTTEMCSHIMNKIGFRTSAAGNTGYTLSEAVMNEENYDIHAVEVSSFQLEDSPSFKPSSALLLNISSDHMDRYQSFEEYRSVKMKIFKNVDSAHSVINHSLLDLWSRFHGSASPFTFSAEKNADAAMSVNNNALFLKENNHITEIIRIPSGLTERHNRENLLGALALTRIFLGEIFHQNIDKIVDAVNSFRIGRHRLEFVLEADGIKFINDSKATNPDSTIAAIDSCGEEKKLRIILGGLDKNMDFTPLLGKTEKIKKAYLTGQCKEKLFFLLKNHISCALLLDFKAAVMTACDEAERGDIVLMSPACASMDEFKNYEERGNKFIEIIKQRFSK